MGVKLGNGKWAIKEDKLLAYNDNSGRFFNKEFDFSRGSSATYVAKDGLIKTAGLQATNLVNNGDFSELGSELVTNGDFDTDSDWSKYYAGDNNSITIANGVLSFDSNTNQNVQQTISSSNLSGFYKITYTITSYTRGNAHFLLGGGSNIYLGFETGTFTKYVQGGGNTNNFVIYGGIFGQGGELSIDNVSVKQVDPNDYWTLQSGWSFGDNKATNDGSGYTNIEQSISNLNNKKIKVQFDIVDYTSGTIRILPTYRQDGADVRFSGNGTYTQIYTSTSDLISLQTQLFVGSVTNISVQEIQADTPRIDFSDSVKGALLLEPQSTNVLENSEITSTWTYTEFGSGSAGTITTGKTDMFGGTNAVQIDFPADVENVTFTFGQTSSSISSGSDASGSVYIKLVESESKTLQLRCSPDITSLINVNETNFVRYQLSGTKSANEALSLKLRPSAGTSSGGFSIIVCQPQEEALSYATSYIPTFGSTATRLADVCINSGSAQDFNDSEGVLYAEYKIVNQVDSFPQIRIADSLLQNQVAFYTYNNTLQYFVKSNNINVVLGSISVSENTDYKFAISYSSAETSVFLNGVKQDSYLNKNMPSNLEKLDIFTSDNVSKYKSVAVFTEALTDEQLQKLTQV